MTKFTPNTEFRSGTGDVVNFNDVIGRIKNFLSNCDDYSIEVGTDSQTDYETRFVTAIVIHKKGRGGIFFYRLVTSERIPWLHDRIYTETSLSINCASELIDLFITNDVLHNVTINCDVGPNGKTREMIREIVGYVTASGFDCKIKPDNTTACAVADRFSK